MHHLNLKRDEICKITFFLYFMGFHWSKSTEKLIIMISGQWNTTENLWKIQSKPSNVSLKLERSVKGRVLLHFDKNSDIPRIASYLEVKKLNTYKLTLSWTDWQNPKRFNFVLIYGKLTRISKWSRHQQFKMRDSKVCYKLQVFTNNKIAIETVIYRSKSRQF